MSPGGSLAPREHFPALERYTYLNAASIALMPLPVLKAKQAFEERIAAAGTISLDEDAEAKALNVPRRIAGRLLGTGEDNIAIVTNATEALAQLAWGLKPGRGANVVSIDIEFPSVTYPWLRVARDTGVEVRLVKAVKDPAALTFDDIASAVDDKTAVLCVSHVQYATGHRFCPKALSDLAHSHGAVSIVDATQSAGVVPMDVERWGVDALMASGYKWLCGPFGAAALYVKPELRDRLAPPVVGWLSNEDPFAFDATRISYARSGRRFEAGTPSYGSGYGLGEAMNYLMDLGVEKCLAHVHGLTRRLREGLERLGAEVVTPADDASRAGVLAARFPGRKAEAVAGELNRRAIVVSPRFGLVRFAPHVYNSEEDIEKALREIKGIVA